MKKIALTYLIILASLVFAVEAEFSINIGVEWIGFDLLHLSGIPYSMFTTEEMEPGDTIFTDSLHGLWIDNTSNIPIDFSAWVYDDTVYLGFVDSLWKIETITGDDSCAFGVALYGGSRSPSISSVIWLDEFSTILVEGLTPGTDRFGYFCVVATSDSVRYGEPTHRLKVVIAATAH